MDFYRTIRSIKIYTWGVQVQVKDNGQVEGSYVFLPQKWAAGKSRPQPGDVVCVSF